MSNALSSSHPGKQKFRTYILVFLAPACFIYTMFMIYPLLSSLMLSFYTADTAGNETFTGFGNFIKLFTNEHWAPRFWGALWNNTKFFIIHSLVQNPVGLLLASLLVNNTLKKRAAFRTILFLPTTLSVVIVGFSWQLILSPLWGVAESGMALFGLEEHFLPWLGLEKYALTTLGLISVWQFIGIPMMLFYTGLLGIPKELIEAATVDGASSWNIFWRIKFILMLPIVGIIAVLTFVGNFNAFDLIYTTQGVLAGPDYSTDLLGNFFYRTFFGHQLQLGNPTMGATIATMMFLIILSFVLLYIYVWQKNVTTYEY